MLIFGTSFYHRKPQLYWPNLHLFHLYCPIFCCLPSYHICLWSTRFSHTTPAPALLLKKPSQSFLAWNPAVTCHHQPANAALEHSASCTTFVNVLNPLARSCPGRPLFRLNQSRADRYSAAHPNSPWYVNLLVWFFASTCIARTPFDCSISAVPPAVFAKHHARSRTAVPVLLPYQAPLFVYTPDEAGYLVSRLPYARILPLCTTEAEHPRHAKCHRHPCREELFSDGNFSPASLSSDGN